MSKKHFFCYKLAVHSEYYAHTVTASTGIKQTREKRHTLIFSLHRLKLKDKSK